MFAFLAYSSVLKMDAVCSSETSASTRRHRVTFQKIVLFIFTAMEA
jgi:hypothetical protein